MLAGDEPPLSIAGVAIGVIGRFTENPDAAGLLVPAHDPIVGNIAPKEAARIAEIDRPLGPAHAGGKAFDAGQQQPIFRKARIEHLH